MPKRNGAQLCLCLQSVRYKKLCSPIVRQVRRPPKIGIVSWVFVNENGRKSVASASRSNQDS